MTRRRGWLVLAGGLCAQAAGPAHAAGPRPGRRRLGLLLFDTPELWAFLAPELRDELSQLGWVEGVNLTTEWRFAGGDATRLPALAAAMANSGVDAIFTRGSAASLAQRQATKTVPVLTGVGDPVGEGFAASLAHPGGNFTGMSHARTELSAKQEELLRAMLPRLSRLSLVVHASQEALAGDTIQALDAAARALGITTRVVVVRSADELGRLLKPTRGAATDAAFVFGLGADIDPKDVAEVTLRAQVPTMCERRGYVEAGGLMSYRLYWDNQTQRVAAQIDKVFRGESPAQIPFEFPTRSELVINARTARALGLKIAPALRVRADEVIE